MYKNILVTSKELSQKHSSNILLKPEWYGPTKSHKDKWAKEAVALAHKSGATGVVVMSVGNQGLAVAYASRLAGLECVICLESHYNPLYIDLFRQYGAEVVVAQKETDQQVLFMEYVEKGYFPLGVTQEHRNMGEDLPALDAYRLTAKEIVGSLKTNPNLIIFPTSYADHSEGALREFIDMKEDGRIDNIPQIILARADYANGSIATSIATDLTTRYVEDVTKRSGGRSLFVDNKEMEAAKEEMLSLYGWGIEISSAAGIACLNKLDKKDLKDKTVVVILTALESKI